MFDSTFLRKKLLFPLTAAMLAATALAWFLPWNGLFVNLATTFLGILLTVGYVDLVLRQHRERQWLEADERLAARVEYTVNVAVTQFRSAFGISHEVIDAFKVSRGDSDRRAEMVRVTQMVVTPEVTPAIRRLTNQEWEHLVRQLEITSESADRLIANHGTRLPPKILASLMDIQDGCRRLMNLYRLVPEFFGVDREPQTDEAEAWKRELYSRCEHDILGVLGALVRVLKLLAQDK